ncbi:MAG: PIN domain-containing protein [Rickettsiales bacterium]|nr:PIN domain-containing protein [Rickettsiales bacterium]
MNLFIDTNIFLSFYHLTNEDLSELEKLLKLIKDKEIDLYITEQVIDEIARNRANKIKEKFEAFKNEKFKLQVPSYCKDYEEYHKIKEILKDCERLHSEMLKKIQSDIEKSQLKADILIRKLSECAKKIERTSDIIEKAKIRIELGNPPGKNNSLGDAINWESILSLSVYSFTIISDDSDLYSPLNTDSLNDFLKNEWKLNKKGPLYFYRKLSDFFRKKYPNINLETEQEKDRLIEKLSSSSNFAITHSIIANLSNYEGFTQKQSEDLFQALLNNNQIKWIIEDEDVKSFYKKLYDNSFFMVLDSDTHEKLEKLINNKEDNLPF